MALRFYRDDIAVALEMVNVVKTIKLALTGKLTDGSEFEGADCINIFGNSHVAEQAVSGDKLTELVTYL